MVFILKHDIIFLVEVSHSIYGTGIFTYSCYQNQLNVGIYIYIYIYIPYMDPMGTKICLRVSLVKVYVLLNADAAATRQIQGIKVWKMKKKQPRSILNGGEL